MQEINRRAGALVLATIATTAVLLAGPSTATANADGGPVVVPNSGPRICC